MQGKHEHLVANCIVNWLVTEVALVDPPCSRASEYGLVRVDKNGRITEFQEKPRGDDLEAMVSDFS